MAWNALKTWTTEILTSTDLNAQVRDNVGFLKSIFESYTVFRDEKPANTAGQTFTIAAWNTRQINVKEGDDAGNLTLSSNKITFTPGRYYVSFKVNTVNNAANANNQKLRLRDTTGGVTYLSGQNYAVSNVDGATLTLEGIINVATTVALDLEHYVSSASGGTQIGGTALNVGEVEVYLMGTVIRLDDV